jgi:hypothetical protein
LLKPAFFRQRLIILTMNTHATSHPRRSSRALVTLAFANPEIDEFMGSGILPSAARRSKFLAAMTVHRMSWLAALMVMAAPSAQATLTVFGSNIYDYISAPGISWAEANTAAAATTYDGINGHLATILSAGENNFLATSFTSFGSFAGSWLGGGVDTSGAGIWLVGPEAGLQFSQGQSSYLGAYENWGGIEPNNAPSDAYLNIGTPTSGISHGQWADAAEGLAGGGDPIQGYFVEFENGASAPEPSTLLLCGAGLAGLAARRLRRKPISLAHSGETSGAETRQPLVVGLPFR